MEERICVKCGHAVNLDLTKDKVYCTNCGHLIYENDNSCGYIKINRVSKYFYCAVSLDCYLDKKREAVVGNGKEVVLSKPFGEYEFYCKYLTSLKSKKINLKLGLECNNITLNVYPGMFNPIVKVNELITAKDKLKNVLIYILYIAIVFIIFFIIGFILV